MGNGDVNHAGDPQPSAVALCRGASEEPFKGVEQRARRPEIERMDPHVKNPARVHGVRESPCGTQHHQRDTVEPAVR